MYDDDMGLDEMIENPLRNLDSIYKTHHFPSRSAQQPEASRHGEGEPAGISDSDNPESPAEQNHPLDLRTLALEKNHMFTAKKLDDIKRIIEHQNERIRLLEEELEILREALEKIERE